MFDNLNQGLDFLLVEVSELLKRVIVALDSLWGVLGQCTLDVLGPLNLIPREKNLTKVCSDQTCDLILVLLLPTVGWLSCLGKDVELLH